MTLDPGLCWDPTDFLLMFYGQGANAIPTLPGVMTAAVGGGAQSAGPLGHRSSYRFLQAGDSSIGTWGSTGGAETNGIGIILRGVHLTTPIGRASGTGASGSNANYPALTSPLLGGSTSHVFAGVHTTGSATTISTPPTGMTNIEIYTGETVRRAIHWTAAPVSAWASQTQSAGSGGAYQTTVIEIRKDPSASAITLRDTMIMSGQTLLLPAACVAAERFMVAYLG